MGTARTAAPRLRLALARGDDDQVGQILDEIEEAWQRDDEPVTPDPLVQLVCCVETRDFESVGRLAMMLTWMIVDACDLPTGLLAMRPGVLARALHGLVVPGDRVDGSCEELLHRFLRDAPETMDVPGVVRYLQKQHDAAMPHGRVQRELGRLLRRVHGNQARV